MTGQVTAEEAAARAAAIARIRAHPAFPDAFRHIGARFLALQGDYLANKTVADEGRTLVSQFALSLHAGWRPEDPASGLTLANLLRVCLKFGVMSHGRVEATVAMLRRSGRLLDAPPGPDRRFRRLIPGPLLEAEYRARVRLHLEALEMVEPGRPYLRRLDTDHAFYWAIERERGAFLMRQPAMRVHQPGLAAVTDIEGGYLCLVALIHALPDGYTPDEIAFPHAEAAARLDLPRTQLRRALGVLEGQGLIVQQGLGGKRIRVLPAAVETLAGWHALRLWRFERNAQRAAAAMDAEAGSTPR